MTFAYEVRPADRFYRTDNPDAHEVMRTLANLGRGGLSIGVWKTRETAQAVADALGLFEGEQLR